MINKMKIEIQKFELRFAGTLNIQAEENAGDNKLTEPYNSKSAQKMSTLEMRDLIWEG